MTTQNTIEVPTLESTYKGFNSDPSSNMRGMDEWACKLTYEGREFSFPFFMGIGHNKKAPDVYTVLNSLFSDAFTGFHFETVKEFMNEFSYEDKQEASIILQQCKRTAECMLHLFGVDLEGFDDLQEQYREMDLID